MHALPTQDCKIQAAPIHAFVPVATNVVDPTCEA